MKQRKGFSAKEIAAKKSKLQDIMHPVTYAENYQLLKESGFCVIETFFHWYNFIGLIALK